MDGSENRVTTTAATAGLPAPMDADSLTASAAAATSWTTAADDFLFPASSASSCNTSPSSAAIASAAARAQLFNLSPAQLDASHLPHLSSHAPPPVRLNSFNSIPSSGAGAPGGGSGIHHMQVPSLLTGFSRHRQLQFSRSVPSSPTFAHSRTPLFPNSNLLAAAARQFTTNAQSISTPATPAGSASDLFLSTFQESPSDIASSLDLAGGGANSGLSPDPSIRSGSGFDALLDDANAGFSFDTQHMADVPAPPAPEPELLRLPSMKKRKSASGAATPPAKVAKTEEKGGASESGGEGGGSGDGCKAKGQKEENGAGDQGEAGNAAAGKESKPPDPPKQDYIHVRARRGQATDSHSLAERVRREKISERMKFLQDLVPGCNKVTGKAVMLDEIINYVQSLQRQVEFLSMKLSAVSGNTSGINDQASQGLSHGAAAAAAVSALSLMTGSSLQQQQLIQSQAAAAQNSIACLQATTSQLLQQHSVNPSAGRPSPYQLDHSTTDQSAIAQGGPADHQLQHHPSNPTQINNIGSDLSQQQQHHHHHQQQAAAWEDELQSIVQMAGFS